MSAHARHTSHGELVRRLVALSSVCLLLAGSVVATITVRRDRDRYRAAPTSIVSFVAPSGPATSTAWFCPGPLPVGRAGESASIAVANVADRTVSGEITYALSSGGVTSSPLKVKARSQTVFVLPSEATTASAAATVLADGTGIGVSEIVHDQAESTSSPCVNRTVSTEYFAAGSTKGSSDVRLALYDPGATPSVVSVSFSTSGGLETPARFQGVPVAPGSTVVLDVGHAVPQQRLVATTVSSTGGKIVAGAMLSTEIADRLVGSLVLGLPGPSSSWYFGGAPAGGTTKQVFTIYNPSSAPSPVGVEFAGSASKASAQLTVAADATATFSAPSSKAHGVVSWVKVMTRKKSRPIVVGRALYLESAVRSDVPKVKHHLTCLSKGRRRPCVRWTSAVFALPSALLPGYSVAAASPAPEAHWLVPGGESNREMSEMISIVNPGNVPARVVLTRLDGRAYRGLSDLEVAPKGAGVLDLGRLLPGLKRQLPVVVSADRPIIVNGALYARGDSQTGFSSFSAIPLK